MAEAIAVIYCFQLAFYLTLIAPRIRASLQAEIISVETGLRRDQEAEDDQTRTGDHAEHKFHFAWMMYGFIFFLLICMHDLFDEYPLWSMSTFALLFALGVLILLLLRADRENVEEVSIDMAHRERIAPELERIARNRRRLIACFNGWMACMGMSVLWLWQLTGSTPQGFWEAFKGIARRNW